jgi:hypothetical protein
MASVKTLQSSLDERGPENGNLRVAFFPAIHSVANQPLGGRFGRQGTSHTHVEVRILRNAPPGRCRKNATEK